MKEDHERVIQEELLKMERELQEEQVGKLSLHSLLSYSEKKSQNLHFAQSFYQHLCKINTIIRSKIVYHHTSKACVYLHYRAYLDFNIEVANTLIHKF